MNFVEACCPECNHFYRIIEKQINDKIFCKECEKEVTLKLVQSECKASFDEESLHHSTENSQDEESNDLIDLSLEKLNHKDMAILQSIMKYSLASKEQIQKGLSIFFEQTDEKKKEGLIQVFKDEGILCEEDVNFVHKLYQFFNIKAQDRKIAELAVKNKFVTLKQAETAFKQQIKLFKQEKKVKSISEILIMSKLLKQEYCDALMYRLNIISPEMRKSLFGNIAVSEGLINDEQRNAVLSIQQSEFILTSKIRLFGSILIDLNVISKKQCNQILKYQKKIKIKEEFEKKWNVNLDLLAPLFNFQELKPLLYSKELS